LNESYREGDHLQPLGGGRFKISGNLTFEFATHVLERSKTLFAEHKNIHIDLSGIKEADSAGLALLIEWLSWAKRSERELGFENIPYQITAIAEISEVSDFLTARVET
jgi:phospholipid transport system transporter-binding protein